MLVLTRHPGEHIVIEVPERDDPIILTLISLKSGKVRLGITAEEEIKVYRSELEPNRHSEIFARIHRNTTLPEA